MSQLAVLLWAVSAVSWGLSCLHIITPGKWGGRPANCSTPLKDVQTGYVVTLHTAGRSCSTQAECNQELLNIQQHHMNSKGWCNLAYNFLIGEDGNVYEGRGWNTEGAHTYGYNDIALGIAFIRPPPAESEAPLHPALYKRHFLLHVRSTQGPVPPQRPGRFSEPRPLPRSLSGRSPNAAAWVALKRLLHFAVEAGYLSSNYLIMAHGDVSNTISPGQPIPNVLKTWPHYKH
nr:peptidoglycan recognition protein 3-like [Pelodiscus sinensis]|eukprot:XP_014425775.1 peptidoglycan recognition protein 3-like [Pelodiscus sinensis]